MSNKLYQVKGIDDVEASKKATECIDGFFFDQLKELFLLN